MLMRNFVRWATVIGAFPRIAMFENRMTDVKNYINRVRIVNDVLGPNWAFRLRDIVGDKTIQANRSSWYDFYVADTDGMHLPLDPGAPETLLYLGDRYSARDLAFYAGMGFDGYCLVLQTQRIVSHEQKSILFDGRYHLVLPDDVKSELHGYDIQQHIPKEKYYEEYAVTLDAIYRSIGTIIASAGSISSTPWMIERTAAACLLLMCGGHKGCKGHPSEEERFAAQMDSLIIFNTCRLVISGMINLEEHLAPTATVVEATTYDPD